MIVDIYEGDEDTKKLINSYVVNFRGDSHNYYRFGDKIITVATYNLDEDATDYTVSSSGTKQLKVYESYDIVTGDHQTISPDFVLQDTYKVFKDENGVNNYAYVKGNFINNKLVDNYFEAIIDSDFNIVYDVTGQYIDSYVRLKSGYLYNSYTKNLYDPDYTNLVESFTHNTYLNLLPEAGIIIAGAYVGKGIYKDNGEVIHPFSLDTEVTFVKDSTGAFVSTKNNNNITVTYYGDGVNSGDVLGTYDQSKGESFNVLGSIRECVYQSTKVEDEANGVYEYTFFDTYGEELYSYLSTDGISIMHHGTNHEYNRRGFSVFYESDPDTGAMEYTALTYLGYNDFTPVSFE